jgi:hypothetical protein
LYINYLKQDKALDFEIQRHLFNYGGDMTEIEFLQTVEFVRSYIYINTLRFYILAIIRFVFVSMVIIVVLCILWDLYVGKIVINPILNSVNDFFTKFYRLNNQHLFNKRSIEPFLIKLNFFFFNFNDSYWFYLYIATMSIILAL